MKFRLFLATVLSLPCLALVGCGGSSSTTPVTTEASTGTVTAEAAAKAQAEMDQVADAERAYQKENPVGPVGKKR